MRLRFISLAAAAALICGCAADEREVVTITVSTDLERGHHSLPVVVAWQGVKNRLPASTHVVLNAVLDGRDIPSQVDDLDGDGTVDELFFVVEKPAGRHTEIMIIPSQVEPAYPPRTQAMLAVRQNGRFSEKGLYVDGSDYTPVDRVEVPIEQEQDSDWAKFEGPVWESDLVGYRYYLDDRFRTDVFGKSVPEPVLHKVKGDYHTISDWGADVLKVGASLGLGTPALIADSGLAVVDNADRRTVEIVASGPLRSIIRTTIEGWVVPETSLDLVSELEIHSGQRWTEQRLAFTGLPDGSRLATGIVRHPDAAELWSGEVAGILYMYTWGPQADQGDDMGMAVLVPLDQNPSLDEPDPETHLVTFNAVNGEAVYRYLASWELEPDPIPDREAFEAVVRDAAECWALSENVVWK